MEPAVITVGTFHGGTKNNIIPEEVKLQLTVRTYSPEVRKRILKSIERIAKGEAMTGGAPRDPEVTVKPGTDAVYNDPELTLRMASALRTTLGKDNVVEMAEEMTSEDFSQYGKGGAKAVLLHVGAVDGAKLAAAQQSGTKLPGVHTPFWSPMVEPTLKTSIRVETAELLELMGTK